MVAEAPRAREVDFTDVELVVRLEDGRTLLVPLSWLPRLRQASAVQRRACALLDDGEVLRWEEIDEDLSVPGLLGLPD